MNWKKKKKLIINLSVIGAFLFCLIFLFYVFIGFSTNKKGSSFNKGHNAVWIGHEWVGEKKTDDEIYKLVSDFKKYQIDTVFVHSGPFNEDGTIDPKIYGYAIEFLKKAKAIDKDIKYQAWLGQLRKNIDLSDKEVRSNIKLQAVLLTDFIGFDGIHFDIEPVWDGDTYFIDTLRETKEAIPKGKIISVAMAEFIPNFLVWISEKIHKFENYNTEVNYKNVGEYADQIVVMAYDTGINKEWIYKWFLKEQVVWVTRLFKNKEIFVGIPAYDEVNKGFNPNIENVKNGILGIVEGLNNLRSNVDNFAGIAIYPYWEIDDEEWGNYEKLWLK